MRAVLGFDMETDIGSWTPWYEGYRPGTEMILRILNNHGVPATFFFTSDAAKKNPAVLRLVRDAGHEIGAHSLYHETLGDSLFEIPGVTPVLPEEVENRLRINTLDLEKLAGTRPTSFRAPRLFGSTAIVNALEKLGYVADATYPLYYFRERLAPYHPSRDDWTKEGDLRLVELPNFADLSMASKDEYGRDMDQWPLFRTEGAGALMRHVDGYAGYCRERAVEPFLCFYLHPWEFHPMPEGLLHYGEGAVLPDPFIVKNTGEVAGEQLSRVIGMLKERGCAFQRACDVVV